MDTGDPPKLGLCLGWKKDNEFVLSLEGGREGRGGEGRGGEGRQGGREGGRGGG